MRRCKGSPADIFMISSLEEELPLPRGSKLLTTRWKYGIYVPVVLSADLTVMLSIALTLVLSAHLTVVLSSALTVVFSADLTVVISSALTVVFSANLTSITITLCSAPLYSALLFPVEQLLCNCSASSAPFCCAP